MRHRKRTCKLGRTSSHNRCMFANMMKSLLIEERITTTVAKAKELRRRTEKMITVAKRDNTLTGKRRAHAEMMLSYNSLAPWQQRAAKEGDTSAYNADRRVLDKLFNVIGPRFAMRQGGYTRIVRAGRRAGDGAETCVIELLAD